MSLYITDENGKLHKIAGAGGGSGASGVVDDALNPDSINAVQNKVLYNPVSFAEDERQKSKNLWGVIFNGSFSQQNIDVKASDNIYFMNKWGAASVVTTPDHNSLTFTRNGGDNAFKIKIKGFKANTLHTASFVVSSGDFTFAKIMDIEMRPADIGTKKSFSFTTDNNGDYVFDTGAYLSANGYVTIVNIMICKGEDVEYQPYNGEIVHKKDIADVEHVETIYDINNGKTRLGSSDYGSGILGGVDVTGCDFSKYKRLVVYAKLGFSTIVYSIDLTFPNADISTNVLSGYAYCGGDSLANIDNGAGTSKSSCLISSDLTKFKHHLIGWSTETTWNDRSNRGDWYIYKIEGVLK